MEGVSHYTTELSSRFIPCFGGNSNDDATDLKATPNSFPNPTCCLVTRCTIPNAELPPDRSAH
eukprot:3245014-Ditylum_brightwellii.AAC.1